MLTPHLQQNKQSTMGHVFKDKIHSLFNWKDIAQNCWSFNVGGLLQVPAAASGFEWRQTSQLECSPGLWLYPEARPLSSWALKEKQGAWQEEPLPNTRQRTWSKGCMGKPYCNSALHSPSFPICLGKLWPCSRWQRSMDQKFREWMEEQQLLPFPRLQKISRDSQELHIAFWLIAPQDREVGYQQQYF